MNEELITTDVAITMVPNNTVDGDGHSSSSVHIPSSADDAISTNPTPSQVVTVEEDNPIGWDTTGANISNSNNTNSADGTTMYPPRRISANKNRKKSRKLTQVCAEEVAANVNPQQNRQPEPLPVMKEKERLHVSPSLMSVDSVSSRSSSISSASTTSSFKPNPQRKINRIFSMLQRMQHTFIQSYYQQQQQDQQQQQQQENQDQFKSAMASDSDTTTAHYEANQPNNIRRQQLRLDLNQATMSSSDSSRLYNLSRSRDSLVSSGSLVKMNPLAKGHNAWAGSQYSGFTCSTPMTEGPPPPLVHAMPYHKDGWTSLFIVGSSTYAQLLIVICIVAALSEVVTHNVPFLYFEVYFAYLYVASILFFLYVFGYLLRSKRRREEKKRMRKLSKARRISNMTNNQSSAEESDTYSQVNHNASISMENEYAEASVGRFIVSNTDSQRRRFSRTDLAAEIKGEPSKSISENPLPTKKKSLQWTPSVKYNSIEDSPASDAMSYSVSMTSDRNVPASSRNKSKKMKVSDNEHSHGSFFLRAGAVAFGLGTMIYDGLEFGAFLEVPPDSPCFALLRGLNPILHAAFVFLQMYFIFISARLNIHKFKAFARFGLMHCLATNVCVWVRTLVRESLKEINTYAPYYEKAKKEIKLSMPTMASDNFLQHVAEAVAAVVKNNENDSSESLLSSSEFLNDTLAEVVDAAAKSVKSKKVMSLWELTGNVSCGRRFVLGDLIMDAAPFLYPFLIEYSLIGAAVIYVTWSHIGVNPKYYKAEGINQNDPDDSIWNSKTRQLRVDCVGASKGLFVGLIFLTGSLLCLILFFIFTPQPQFHSLGLFLADAAHCVLLLVSLCAMALGAYRSRHMHFHADHMEELGSILLRVSALGMFAYSVFSMIAGALANSSTHEPPIFVFINGLLSVVEVTIQTLYISDMSRRSVNTPEQDREKPGRQSVTFLLITNMTLWLFYTFEIQKVVANPVQLHFYGFLPWAIVQRITLPLCIFYRFHSAIVYSEIWKNSYRYHGPSTEALPHQQ